MTDADGASRATTTRRGTSQSMTKRLAVAATQTSELQKARDRMIKAREERLVYLDHPGSRPFPPVEALSGSPTGCSTNATGEIQEVNLTASYRQAGNHAAGTFAKNKKRFIYTAEFDTLGLRRASTGAYITPYEWLNIKWTYEKDGDGNDIKSKPLPFTRTADYDPMDYPWLFRQYEIICSDPHFTDPWLAAGTADELFITPCDSGVAGQGEQQYNWIFPAEVFPLLADEHYKRTRYDSIYHCHTEFMLKLERRLCELFGQTLPHNRAKQSRMEVWRIPKNENNAASQNHSCMFRLALRRSR